MHIVDQHDGLAPEPVRRIGRESEGPGNRFLPPAWAQSPKYRRCLDPPKQVRVDPDTAALRKRDGDECRLVESARPDSPAMERHRDQQIGAVGQQPRHRPRHRRGIGHAPSVFELERHLARNIAISDSGAHAVVRRRIVEARCAPCLFATIELERQVAGGAPGRTEKPKLAPAGRAEAMIRLGNDTATRTAWGERQIGKTRKRCQQPHARLVPRGASLHKPRVSNPEIFDRALRRRRRDRAAPDYPAHAFLRQHMLDGIAERLEAVKRQFRDVLDLGCFDGSFTLADARIARCDAGLGFARTAGGVQADEDRLPFADKSFDLIVSAGVLDSVNDVPGALALARRALRPDGLFLAAFVGAGSLPALRSALLAAEVERPVARFHPQIDVRSAGDLLSRAGFALPVADTESLVVRYAGIGNLLRDLRGMAAGNLLPDTPPIARATLARAAEAFFERADPDGRTAERFEIVYLTGWAPDASQPKPARRGSATVSLIEALKPRPD